MQLQYLYNFIIFSWIKVNIDFILQFTVSGQDSAQNTMRDDFANTIIINWLIAYWTTANYAGKNSIYPSMVRRT